jgi:hydroxymethylpyrimidine pyrophosphatase-like HAD family hydrolase
MNERYMQTRINAVLSDYDGTLAPTNTLRSFAHSIPEPLEGVLWKISQSIPVCVISSKDYHFLHPRTGFARILSCIMGVETISHRIHNEASNEIKEGTNYSDSPSCVRERYILPNSQKILQTNSVLLSKLAESIELEFKANVIVERKFTSDRQFLAGITIDYRHLKNWKSYKNRLEPLLMEIIQKYRSFSLCPMSDLYVQTYRSHPFVDVYALYCDKGMAFDLVADHILNIKTSGGGGGKGEGILYLGDSENDNPAFCKASISIGIISDKRLTPQLDCQYLIEFNKLYGLLERLVRSKFLFSEDLLIQRK